MSATLDLDRRPASPPALQRLRATLFADWPSALVSSALLLVLGWAAWRLLRWGVLDAVVQPDPDACRAAAGACWGVVSEKARHGRPRDRVARRHRAHPSAAGATLSLIHI